MTIIYNYIFDIFMSRACSILPKRPMFGHNVSHANNKTNRTFFPNVRWVRVYSQTLNIMKIATFVSLASTHIRGVESTDFDNNNTYVAKDKRLLKTEDVVTTKEKELVMKKIREQHIQPPLSLISLPGVSNDEYGVGLIKRSIERCSNLSHYQNDLISRVLPSVLEKSQNKDDIMWKLSHFLGQCFHETNGFKTMEENMKYTREDRIQKVFSKSNFDKYNVQYKECVNNPEKLANVVYADRLGNGNFYSGDGFRFRGRGMIQITGLKNYQDFNQYLKQKGFKDDVEIDPDLVSKRYACLSALWYFEQRDLLKLCVVDPTEEHYRELTKKINGSSCLGLNERKKHTLFFAQDVFTNIVGHNDSM